MAAAVCGDDAGDVSAGAGGVWGVGGGGEGCARTRCDVSIGCSPGLVWETGVATLQDSQKESTE